MNIDGLGLESGHATVVTYDPRWSILFNEMAALLRQELAGRILDIEHVGSTSVAGLAAKPILDMLIGVPDFGRAHELFPDLLTLGFEYRPDEEIPDRHFFRKRTGGKRTHHLSLAEPTSSYYRSTLIFRDALRHDHTLARSYESLKRSLAHRFPRDRESYQAGKTEFVERVLQKCGFGLPSSATKPADEPLRTIHDAAVRAEISRCLERLAEDARPMWGNFTCAGMFYHLNAQMRMALGELVAEPVGNPAFWHSKGKAIALSEDPWPEGAPTSKEALPPDGVDFERERKHFRVLLERMASTGMAEAWPDSARFGPMTGAEWSRLTFTHIRHHFRQFGVWAESTT